ncbi:MAG TPA: MMPL family transporter [Candidatus Limnocylindrales bacterium]
MSSSPGAVPPSKPLTVRVATWSARHRWPVFAAWFVFTIGLFVLSGAMGGTRTMSSMSGGTARTESALADQTFATAGTSIPHETFFVVARSASMKVTDAEYRAAVADILARLQGARDAAGQPAIDGVIDPYVAPPEAGMFSADQTSVRIVGALTGDADAVEAKAAALRPVLDGIRSANPAFEIRALNNTLINEDLNKLVGDDLDGSMKLTLPATFLILLVAFGAAVAAAVPLLLALSALLAGFGILGIYSQLVAPVAMSTNQLVVLIGLAVGVDYSLFMITRFRSERRAGRERIAAIETASGTAGRAVFFSGLAVAVSLAGLFTIRESVLDSMAVATIGVVVVAVIGSLTFLPATLAILGDRVNRGRLPVLGRERREGTGLWASVVGVVVRWPAVLGTLAISVLLLVASPLGHLRMGSTDINSFPPSVDGVAAIKLLNAEWPQGTTLHLDVVVTRANEPATQAAIAQLQSAGLADGGVNKPVTVEPSADGTVARVSFVMPGDQNDPTNQATVGRFRATIVPSAFGSLPDVKAYVSGGAAYTLDNTRIFTDGIPLVLLFVLGLSFVLLLVAFRSIVIPATAITLNLLSTGAAYGIMTLVFQDGWFARMIGATPGPVIESFVPLMVFTIVYGLSMDYHFFILTRIKEARDRGLDSRAAVARGISITAGTITSAAAIMVVVFSVFVTMKFAMIQQLGLGLAVAVFVDATIIRSILLPAVMRLLGDRNWYLPSALAWLPRVTVEAEPEAADEPAGEPATQPAPEPKAPTAPKPAPRPASRTVLALAISTEGAEAEAA